MADLFEQAVALLWGERIVEAVVALQDFGLLLDGSEALLLPAVVIAHVLEPLLFCFQVPSLLIDSSLD